MAKAENEQQLFKGYVTEALRLIGENVAKLTQGQYIAQRWPDMIRSTPEKEQTAEEITADIVKKAGLVVRRREFI